MTYDTSDAAGAHLVARRVPDDVRCADCGGLFRPGQTIYINSDDGIVLEHDNLEECQRVRDLRL